MAEMQGTLMDGIEPSKPSAKNSTGSRLAGMKNLYRPAKKCFSACRVRISIFILTGIFLIQFVIKKNSALIRPAGDPSRPWIFAETSRPKSKVPFG
jgi:hypothetical protein